MEQALAAADTAWFIGGIHVRGVDDPGSRAVLRRHGQHPQLPHMMMMTFGSFAVVGCAVVLFGYSTVLGNSLGGLGILGDPLEFVGLGQLLEPSAEPGLPPALVRDSRCCSRPSRSRSSRVRWPTASSSERGCSSPACGSRSCTSPWPTGVRVRLRRRQRGRRLGSRTSWEPSTSRAAPPSTSTPVSPRWRWSWCSAAARVPEHASARTTLPLTLLGAAGILLFGWFGFNGGSALAADNAASVVVLNTVAAACAGICGWLLVERVREGRPTSLGAASGLIAALVAITPACGAVSPIGALVIGAAAVRCAASRCRSSSVSATTTPWT